MKYLLILQLFNYLIPSKSTCWDHLLFQTHCIHLHHHHYCCLNLSNCSINYFVPANLIQLVTAIVPHCFSLAARLLHCCSLCYCFQKLHFSSHPSYLHSHFIYSNYFQKLLFSFQFHPSYLHYHIVKDYSYLILIHSYLAFARYICLQVKLLFFSFIIIIFLFLMNALFRLIFSFFLCGIKSMLPNLLF